jgi:type I site-specific restriction endonuclease
MQVFGVDRQRASLLVMATGTGKTRLAVALVLKQANPDGCGRTKA